MNNSNNSIRIIFLFCILFSIIFSAEPSERSGPSLTNIGNEEILLFGGAKEEVRFNDLWKFTYVDEVPNWEQLTPGGITMPEITEHAAVLYDGNIYIIGGLTEENYYDDNVQTRVYKYSIAENIWSELTLSGDEIPTKMFSHVAVLIGDKICVNYQDETWRFDPADNSWLRLADSPTYDADKFNYQWHSAGVWNNKMVIFRNGPQTNGEIQIYDPSNNTWSVQIPSPSTGLSKKSVAGVPPGAWSGVYWIDGDYAYTGLGRDAQTNMLTTEFWRLNLSEMKWDQLPLELDKRYHGAAAPLTSTKILITGGYEEEQVGNKYKPYELIEIENPNPQFILTTTVIPIIAGDDGCFVQPSGSTLLNKNDNITIAATPGDGWKFVYWSGDLTGSINPGFIIMDSDKTVNGNFQPTLSLGMTSEPAENHAPPLAEEYVYIGTAGLKANSVEWNLYGLRFVPSEKVKAKYAQAYLIIDNKVNHIQGTITEDQDGNISELLFSMNELIPEGSTLHARLYYKFYFPEDENGLVAPLDEVKKLGVSINYTMVSAEPKPEEARPGIILPEETFSTNIQTIASIWNVSVTPNLPFIEIPNAISDDNTQNGHIIEVWEGNYKIDKQLRIDKSITITGKGDKDKVILSNDVNNCIFFNTNNIVLKNFTIKSKETFFNLNSNEKIEISDNEFQVADDITPTITMTKCVGCKISYNSFTGGNKKKYILDISESGKDNTIECNVITTDFGKVKVYNTKNKISFVSNKFTTIDINNTDNIELSDNEIDTMTINSAKSSIFSDNIFKRLILDSVADSKIESNEGESIYLKSCTKMILFKNKLFNSTQEGIMIDRCTDIEINNNEIKDARINGIFAGGPAYGWGKKIIIRGNKISGSVESGIALYDCDGSKIIGNEIFSNGQNGIVNGQGFTGGSENIEIKFNRFYYNARYGISDNCSKNNLIEGNSIFGNGYSGIDFYQTKGGSCVINNHIFNHNSQRINSGLHFYAGEGIVKCIGNTIVNNCNGIYNESHVNNTKLILKNNKISNSTCLFTGIKIIGCEFDLNGNEITGNNGAGVALYENAFGTLANNNIYGNPDLAIQNNTDYPEINANGNYWGENGPMDDMFEGNIVTDSWLNTPVSMVLGVPYDTLFASSGTIDTMAIGIQNYMVQNDNVEFNVSDDLGWLSNSGTRTLTLVDSTFTLADLYLEIPETSDPILNKVTFTATSQTDNSMFAVDSFYILNYKPELVKLALSPDSTVFEFGDTLYLNATGYDQNNNSWDDDLNIEWSSSYGTIDSNNIFICDSVPQVIEFIATENITGIVKKAYISVSPHKNWAEIITISPDSISVNPGSNIIFFTRGSDHNGFYVDFVAKWTAIGGEIDSMGNYIASETPGIYTVTVLDTNSHASVTAYVTVRGETAIDDEIFPEQYSLCQNYPNPFNPTTTIAYSLPFDSNVKIEIYNLLGQRVESLKNEIQPTGYYQLVWDANNYATGIYLIKMRAISMDNSEIFTDVKKMVLLK